MAIHNESNDQRTLNVPPTNRDVQQKYLFRKCEHRECTVMIGWQAGALQGQTECKWCLHGISHWQVARLA
jgi:hypothetical protein